MGNLRQALNQRRDFQKQLHARRQDAAAAMMVMHAQYRRHTLLGLAAASTAGMLFGAGRLRPPRPLLRAALSWSMILLRSLLQATSVH